MLVCLILYNFAKYFRKGEYFRKWLDILIRLIIIFNFNYTGFHLSIQQMETKEDLDLIFFRIIDETKADYALYIYRYPPDKEWIIDDIFHGYEKKPCNETISVSFSHGSLDCYRLAKTLEPFLGKSIKLNDTQISACQLSEKTLHPNIQIIVVLITSASLQIHISETYISQLSVQFLKKYINRVVEETNDSVMKLISKLRTPINEIITMPMKQDVVKHASVGIAIIINDLIDLYKLKKNKLKLNNKEFEFRKFIQDLNEIVGFQKCIDEDVPEYVYTDQRRLKQVLINLIGENSSIYIGASLCFDIIPENKEADDCVYKIEFNIENIEALNDERLFITKKLISLMNGSLSITGVEARFTIRVFKNYKVFSKVTMKRIKGKKIIIIDYNVGRKQELIDRLGKWGLIIVELEVPDLIIVSVQMLEKAINYINNTPYLILSDVSNEDDITPSNSPRMRQASIPKTNILKYPIDESELISIVMDALG